MINENSINSNNYINNTSNRVVTLPLRGTLKYLSLLESIYQIIGKADGRLKIYYKKRIHFIYV